jgi:hypothetical protein
LLSFTYVYFFESRLFNELHPIQTKKPAVVSGPEPNALLRPNLQCTQDIKLKDLLRPRGSLYQKFGFTARTQARRPQTGRAAAKTVSRGDDPRKAACSRNGPLSGKFDGGQFIRTVEHEWAEPIDAHEEVPAVRDVEAVRDVAAGLLVPK